MRRKLQKSTHSLLKCRIGVTLIYTIHYLANFKLPLPNFTLLTWLEEVLEPLRKCFDIVACMQQEPTVQQTCWDFYIHNHRYPTCFRFLTKDVRSDRIYAQGMSHMGDLNIDARKHSILFSDLNDLLLEYKILIGYGFLNSTAYICILSRLSYPQFHI